MAGALRELIADFFVSVDDKKLDDSSKKMEGIVATAQKAAAAIGIAFGLKEIGEFIIGQVEAAATLLHTSEMLGMTTEQLQRFEYAASTMGVSADEASTSIRFLNKNIGEAATKGGDGAQVFAKLGVHLKDANGQIRPTSDVLADVADGFSKLHSPAEKTAVSMELFGRAGARMIPMLNKGSAGVAELNAEFDALGGGMSKQFIEDSEKTEHEMAKLSLASRGLKSTVAAALLPMFTSLVGWVTQTVAGFRAFAEHSYIVQSALGVLGAVAVGLIGIWAVLNVEILIVVAAIALITLAVDDVYTAMNGGKSVVGDFIDSLFGIGATQAMFNQLNSWVENAKIQFSLLGLEIKAVASGASDMANEVLHALHVRSDAEYEAKKADNKRDMDANYKRSWELDDEWYANKAKPGAAETMDKIQNDYAQQTQLPAGAAGPQEGQRAWYDRTLHDGTQTGAQPATGMASAPPGAAASVEHHSEVRQEVNVTVPAGSDARDTGKKVGQAAARALRDTPEDDFDAGAGGGGH